MTPMFQKNPLTMRGTLQRCWLFTYQTPEEEARKLLPPELEPVTHLGFAFWNIVVCRIRAMRPKPLPAIAGFGYWHVGYRIYVRFQPSAGGPLEGLYFLRSDCDSRIMSFLGNRMTDFHFNVAGISLMEKNGLIRLVIDSPDAAAQVQLDRAPSPRLPSHSAFASLEEAAGFLKYKPFGISIPAAGQANIVKIVRDETAWKCRMVHGESLEWAYLKGRNVKPELCFELTPIDYQWNRGQIFCASVVQL